MAFKRIRTVGHFLFVRCMSSVVLFPWVQDLHKPRDGHSHLGPVFSCGVNLYMGEAAETKIVLHIDQGFQVCLLDMVFYLKLPTHCF